MKSLAIALVAALAAACSANSPTSPSSLRGSGTQVADASGSQGSGQTNLGQKLTLFFYSDDDFTRGSAHIVGLPVTVATATIGPTVLYTDKQGSVTVTLPKDDTWMSVSTADYHGYCGMTTTLQLPLWQRVAFLVVHLECGGTT